MAKNFQNSIETEDYFENKFQNSIENSHGSFKSSLVIQLSKKQNIVMASSEDEQPHDFSNHKVERKRVSFHEHATDIDTKLTKPVEYPANVKPRIHNGNFKTETGILTAEITQNRNAETEETGVSVAAITQNRNAETDETDVLAAASTQNGNSEAKTDAVAAAITQNGNSETETNVLATAITQNGNSETETEVLATAITQNGNSETEPNILAAAVIQNGNSGIEVDLLATAITQNGNCETENNVLATSIIHNRDSEGESGVSSKEVDKVELHINNSDASDILKDDKANEKNLSSMDNEQVKVIDSEVQELLQPESTELENKETNEDQELNSFRDQYCESLRCQIESLKQISIPKARLAFVTEMVENSHHSLESKVVCTAKESTTVHKSDEISESKLVTVSSCLQEKQDVNKEGSPSESLEHLTEADNGSDINYPSTLQEDSVELLSAGAIGDKSSVLERRKELKKLWEKKMAEEKQALKVEETVVIQEESKTNTYSNGTAKMLNGTATSENESHPKDVSVIEEATIIDETDTNKNNLMNINVSTNLIEIDENSNVEEITKHEVDVDVSQVCEEEGVVVETAVTETTEKIFTSTLQQTFVITKTEESTTEVKAEEEVMFMQTSAENLEDQEDFEEIERRIEAEESMAQEAEFKEQELASESIGSSADELDLPKELGSHETLGDLEEKGEHTLSSNADSLETLEHHVEEEEEDFVCVGDAVFAGDLESATKDSVTMNGYTASSVEQTVENGEQEEKTFDDHFVLDTHELESPSSDRMLEKHGKKASRIKTEQPYSTCTTETKIAMEIREMREREEELKLMRERQAEVSPPPPSPTQQPVKAAPLVTKATAVQKSKQPSGYISNNTQKIPATPGYRVSSVFGHRPASQSPKEENKSAQRNFNKETPVEREIRLAKDREEELRKQKGLPPREDDSFVKPSQVKSAQAKVFGKLVNAESSRLQATAKIQHEIEEQTMRELALRESGSIQTLSSERTDSKVSKLKPVDTPECVSPTFVNGNSLPYTNGSNGHISPDVLSKRSTPSPTGSNSSYTIASRTSPMMGASGINKGISMQKFIASRGKDSTFSASRNGPFVAKAEYYTVQDTAVTPRAIPEPGKLKRTLSVESKIQQEIMEMKQREEELKLLHSGPPPTEPAENGDKHNGNHRSPMEYQNGQTETEETCPRKSNLIAQWEQRIQNAA